MSLNTERSGRHIPSGRLRLLHSNDYLGNLTGANIHDAGLSLLDFT